MSDVGCSRRFERKQWSALLVCGSLAVVGCGGGDELPSYGSASAESAPAAGHEADPHADHAESAGGELSPPGEPTAVPDAGHDDGTSAPAPQTTQAAPSEAHDDDADDVPPTETAVAPPLNDDTEGTKVAADQPTGKVTTGEWIGGLAAGIFSAAAPPGGIVPPGAAGGPEMAHGEAPAGDVPGEDGAVPGGPEGGTAPQVPADAPEYPAQQLALKLLAGDSAGIGQFISSDAKGDLGRLRDGKAETSALDQAKAMLAGVSYVTTRDAKPNKVIVLRNQTGDLISITVKKESGAYKVSDLRVTDARGRRK